MASLDTRQLVPGAVVASSYPPELQYMEYDQQLQPGGRYSTVSNGAHSYYNYSYSTYQHRYYITLPVE